jgi:extradiol dioxygenase family protein
MPINSIAMNQPAIFHLAIPITDVSTAKSFYCDGLGCLAGRETEKAIILNFSGHQVVAHVTEMPLTPQNSIYPRHFGLILPDASDWDNLLEKARFNQLKFYLEPKTRFTGEITEHKTFFLEDPFYNLLEFKHYRHYEAIFASRELTAIGDRA